LMLVKEVEIYQRFTEHYGTLHPSISHTTASRDYNDHYIALLPAITRGLVPDLRIHQRVYRSSLRTGPVRLRRESTTRW
jgi:hypothetical protein